MVPVVPGGRDNWTFRLGEGLSVRLPRDAAHSGQVERERAWLPKLAAHLPLPIPAPLALGGPGDGFPAHWSVSRWLEGSPASPDRIADLRAFAGSLAAFLTALQKCDATGGPPAGPHTFQRGGLLSTYDDETRRAIAALNDRTEAAALTGTWDAALASAWQADPVWVHGDVAAGNLLVQDGRLSAVIDFGQLCIGDPACDLAIAWTLLTGESREAFRAGLPLDRETWARARGWTLWKALCWAFPDSRRIDWRVVHEILRDREPG